MNKKLLAYFSIVALTCAPTHPLLGAPRSIEVYDERVIGRIDIQAENLPIDASFDSKKVLTRLKTKVGDPFSQLTFDADLKTLSEEYDRVEPQIQMVGGELQITIKVWPRPAIRAIRWHGNVHVKTKTLQKELGIKPKSLFNRHGFNKAFNKVKEYYVKRGYFESQLQYVVIPDPKTNEVEIEITVREGRSGKIDNIIFKGFTSEETSELLGMMYTKKYNLFTTWFTGLGIYNEEALEQDRHTIVNFMQNRGYADAKVEITVRESKAEGKIVLEIDVSRGPVFHFGTVSFYGNTLIPSAQIESAFLVHPGEVYSPEKLRETVDAVKQLYGRKGYIETNIQYDAQLSASEPVYNVYFQIHEGDEYKIGMVRVFGNVQTKTHVILRESLLVPGETFDSAKLKATQARLENIGYFKSVNVYAVRTQDDQGLGENYRDVYIEVEETTTGNVSLFFGFSSADDVFGGLDLSESNFNYRGIPKVFKEGLSSLRGGGEYAHARANVGARQITYSVSWLTPYFRDTYWRVGFDASQSNSTLISKDYEINTFGFSLYASYPLNYYWTFGTKYRFKNAVIHIAKHTPPEERALGHQSGITSGVSASIGFDSTDSAIKPHNGFRSILEAEYVGVFGDFAFAKFGYLNTFYSQLWRGGIMKYRWVFRFIEPLFWTDRSKQIPLSERFFIGGINSVRGYRDFDLGPHFSNGDPKGGVSATVLSLEFLQEVFSFLDLFVFADAGSIALKRNYLGAFRISSGFGARIEMMNRVPIILGMGFPINPRGRSEVRKFFFSMGGQF